MKASDFLTNYILPLIGESSSSYDNYSEAFCGVLNVILADVYEIENSRRRCFRLDELAFEQGISSIDDELLYTEFVLKNIVSYGVASRLLIDEDEEDKMGYLETCYADNFNSYAVATYDK